MDVKQKPLLSDSSLIRPSWETFICVIFICDVTACNNTTLFTHTVHTYMHTLWMLVGVAYDLWKFKTIPFLDESGSRILQWWFTNQRIWLRRWVYLTQIPELALVIMRSDVSHSSNSESQAHWATSDTIVDPQMHTWQKGHPCGFICTY